MYSLLVLIPSLPINPVFASASKSTCGSAVPIPILVPAPTLEFTYTFPKVLTPALLILEAITFGKLNVPASIDPPILKFPPINALPVIVDVPTTCNLCCGPQHLYLNLPYKLRSLSHHLIVHQQN